MRITVVEAPDPKILELVPNKEGQQYPGPQIQQHREEQVYHIKEDGEEVPDDVEVTRVYKVSPGQYEPVEQIIAEAKEIYGPLPRLSSHHPFHLYIDHTSSLFNKKN